MLRLTMMSGSAPAFGADPIALVRELAAPAGAVAARW
jgi:hypothetical protein